MKVAWTTTHSSFAGAPPIAPSPDACGIGTQEVGWPPSPAIHKATPVALRAIDFCHDRVLG
jgi:hypothetical protein